MSWLRPRWAGFMFFPFTALYQLEFDGTFYVGTIWPFAEILGASAAAVMGLFCLWLVLGRQIHWFVRLLPILAMIALATWIPAYDLGAVAALQCLVVIAISLFGTFPRTMQFKLSNLLLGMFVFAAILGIFRNYSSDVFFKWVAIAWFGVGFGVLTCIAWWIVQHTKGFRFGWRWILLILFPAVTLMVLGLRIARTDLTTFSGRLRMLTFAGFVVAPVIAALAFLLNRTPIPEDSPVENGLPAIVAAGHMVPDKRYRPYPKNQAALATAVDASATAIVQARENFEKDGWLGVNYQLEDRGDFEQRIPQRNPLVNLCLAFLANAELAENENRIDDALSSYRDVLKMWKIGGRGGLPLDAALAAECELDSIGRVFSLSKQMNAEQCKAWAKFLVEREPTLEPVELLRRRRRAWVDRIGCWQDRLSLVFLRMLGVAPGERNLQIVQSRQTYVGLQSTHFALQAYQLENGEYPQELAELVPTYLPSVLPDPADDNGFRYRKLNKGFLLYGVGEDGVDDTELLPAGSNVVATSDVTADVVLIWRLLK